MKNPAAGRPDGNFLYYVHPDHLGSASYVTDAQGHLYEHLQYFPFGETWVDQRSESQRVAYLFTGKELDEETGLYYFGARYYDPRTSVWQSPDPILAKYLPAGTRASELQGGGGIFNAANLALYAYAHQKPLIVTDPDGNEAVYIARRDLNTKWTAGVGTHGFVVVVTADPTLYGSHQDKFAQYNNMSGKFPGVPKGEDFWAASLTGTKAPDGRMIKTSADEADRRAIQEVTGEVKTSLFRSDFDLDLTKVNPKVGFSQFEMEMEVLGGFDRYTESASYGAFARGDNYNCFCLMRGLLERGGAEVPRDLKYWFNVDPGANKSLPDKFFSD